MKYNKYGTLSYSNNGECKIEDLNISKALHDIYYWKSANTNSPVITIHIQSDARKLINETGELYLSKNVFGGYSWFINDICIDDVLFAVVDEVIDITINV